MTAHKGKFNASMLRGSDFSGADLTGSSFKSSDAREANFDRAIMDKLTYAALRGLDADLSKAAII